MTKLDTALANVNRLGIDTAPLIYFVERNLAYLDLVREIFRRVDAGTIVGYSSTVTLTEVLTHPKRLGNAVLESEYRQILQHGRNFTLVPVDTAVADAAADIRARYQLRTPDAIHVATALFSGCDAFLTNDRDLQRVSEL